MKPRLPSSFLADLTALANLADEGREEILDQLRSIDRALDPFERIEAALESLAVSKAFEKRLPRLITGLLVYFASNPEKAEIVTSKIIEEFVRQEKGEEQARRLGEFLGRLFQIKNLVESVKGSVLASDVERRVVSSRIVTDIRLVFSNESASEVLGHVLTHNLKIVFEEDNRLRESYFSLGLEELVDLQKHVARALEKQRELRARLVPVADIVGRLIEDR